MATTTFASIPTDGKSTPTASSTQSNSNTASLYLFTFLATILILVLLSSSLVLRSYILRRRYTRRFQQAYTGYPVLDGNPPDALDLLDPWERFRRRAPRRGFGPKPVLWDTWLHPLDKDDTWSSITPVSVRCSPSHPPTLISQPDLNPTPADAPSSSRPQSSFLSQFRITSPFSLSLRSALPTPRQAHTPITSPVKSPPPETMSSDLITCNEKDTSTLSVYVFVAMPDASSPVHHPLPDVKGKGVDPLQPQAPNPGSDADPPLPSSLHRSGPRTADSVLDENGLPFLELGLVQVKTGEWVWENE